MSIQIDSKCKHFSLHLDVEKIEVDPILDDSSDEPYPTYWRDIRIKTDRGEVLELTLAAADKGKLAFRTKPLIQNDEPEEQSADWLKPEDITPVPEDF